MTTLIELTRVTDGTEIKVSTRHIIRVQPHPGGSTVELYTGDTPAVEVVTQTPAQITEASNEGGGGGDPVTEPPNQPTINNIIDNAGDLISGSITDDNSLSASITFDSSVRAGDIVVIRTNAGATIVTSQAISFADVGNLEVTVLLNGLSDGDFDFTAIISNPVDDSPASAVYNITVDTVPSMDSNVITMDRTGVTMDQGSGLA